MRPWGGAAVRRACDLPAEADILPLEERRLNAAADLEGATLRSLDAIHGAAALSLWPDLAELITYDRRMAQAAEGIGLPVTAPA